MTIQEFARTVWASKYLVLAAVLVVVLGAFAYSQTQRTTYEAVTEVELTSSGGGDVENAGPKLLVGNDNDLVRSPKVVEAAIDELGTDEDPEELRTQVRGDFDDSINIMKVVAQGETPEAAIARADAVADAYVESLSEVREAKLDEIRETIKSLTTQINGISDNINDISSAAQREALTEQIRVNSGTMAGLTSLNPLAEVALRAASAEPLGMSSAIILSVAVLMGLVIGVGLAFARRGFDTRVGSSAEAGTVASVPVLAELYGVKSAEKDFARTGVLPVSSRTASPYTESIRELRTAVQVPIGEGGYAVVAVTAADPHAPRAFITANLAASFALSGRATVVVPGDLRQPQLDQILPPPDGWREVAGELRPTRIPNLFILPVSNDTLDPADFLATSTVREMIAAQRANAAVVVIDSPPVLAAADATILGGYAQGVVLVASAGKTNRPVLQEAAERLRTNNVPLVGLALTGLEGDRRMLYASTYGQGEEPIADPMRSTQPDASSPRPAVFADGVVAPRRSEYGAGHGEYAMAESGELMTVPAPSGGGPASMDPQEAGANGAGANEILPILVNERGRDVAQDGLSNTVDAGLPAWRSPSDRRPVFEPADSEPISVPEPVEVARTEPDRVSVPTSFSVPPSSDEPDRSPGDPHGDDTGVRHRETGPVDVPRSAEPEPTPEQGSPGSENTQTRAVPVIQPVRIDSSTPVGQPTKPAITPQRPIRPPSAGPARRR